MQKDTSANWYYGWFLWSLAALFYAYEFIHRIAPSVLTAHLREAFTINEEQLGLIGAFYFYAYAPFQLVSGVLLDKFGVRRVLIIASTILMVASFLFASTHNIYLAYFCRFMIGSGSAFAFIGCLKIGSQWLNTQSFPLVIGLTNFCGTIGALFAGAPLSYAIYKFGWQAALFDLSMVGLTITLLLILFLKDKPLSDTDVSPEKSPNILAGLVQVMRNPQSWLIGLYGALLVAPIATIPEMWGVEYLKIAYHYPPQQAASVTHTIFIGTAFGGPLVGWLMRNSSEETDFMMLATLGALTLLSIFLYWSHLSQPQLHLILFLYGILTANMLLCFDLICRITPSSAHGAAIGFVNMIIMSVGGIGQHSVGWLLNQLRIKHEGIYLIEDYHLALSILPFCLLIAIFITLFIRRDPHDTL